MSDHVSDALEARAAGRGALMSALMGQPVRPESAPSEPEPTPMRGGFDGGAGSRPNVSPVEPMLSEGETWAAILRNEV